MKEEIVQLAGENFWKGFHCSEAVLIAMAEYMGINSNLIPKIATGFGGGIASSGSVCGAVIGGVMAIGIKYGRSQVTQIEEDQHTKNLSRQFMQKFKSKMGSLLCYDITQCDFNTPEGKRKFVEEGIRKECQKLVTTTITMLIELMENNKFKDKRC